MFKVIACNLYMASFHTLNCFSKYEKLILNETSVSEFCSKKCMLHVLLTCHDMIIMIVTTVAGWDLKCNYFSKLLLGEHRGWSICLITYWQLLLFNCSVKLNNWSYLSKQIKYWFNYFQSSSSCLMYWFKAWVSKIL